MIVVDTTAGQVAGSAGPGASHEAGVVRFLGIPYAEAPVGELRFRAPRPAKPWSGARGCDDFGYWSPQNPAATTLSGEVPGAQDEDCLTLNVWTPAADGAHRPVMVWVHGGGFVGGSGASGMYHGAALAARGDVVVVTINYRLGVLGFLAHPDLADPGGAEAGGAAGNWGLLDQVAALAWVRDNIAGFGGDAANVTIFGESAGAMSVSDLLAMPAATGLFHRAIAQSGPPNAMSMARAEENASKLTAGLGVGSVQSLRQVPVAALLVAQANVLSQRAAGLPLTPVVDGTSLPAHPLSGIAGGSAAGVPLLIGTNRDEYKMFIVADPKGRDPDEAILRRRIERAFAASGEQLRPDDAIAAYRSIRESAGEATDPRDLWSAIESDRLFRIGSIKAAEAQSNHQTRTFSYLFVWESPAMRGALGACHALEIPFVFGSLGLPGMDRFAGCGAGAEKLSTDMMDAWLAFARSGDPSHPGIGQWPAYDARRRATMIFGSETAVVDAPMDQERQVWEAARQR
ncbi:MAG: carboxylesterase/lipase family protein [Acidimicrobiales bacterium]